MWPTSPSLQQSSFSYNIGPPQDNLNDLVNSSAKEYNYNNDNKNGENIIDKSKAKNCNNRSDGSGDIDDNNAGDGDSSDSDSSNGNSSDSNSSDGNSSDSDEGNKTYRCIGQRGSLAPISNRLKPKRAIKYYL